MLIVYFVLDNISMPSDVDRSKDAGGYFIINGSENVISKSGAENKVLSNTGKNNTKLNRR